MADSAVAITAGAGTSIDAHTTVGGDLRQVVIGGDPSSSNVQLWNAGAYPFVALDPFSLLYDGFASLDTVDLWTLGGTVPTVVTPGQVQFNQGTAANASSWMDSKFFYKIVASSFNRYGALVQLAAAAETGSKAWWGAGDIAGAPTLAVPLSNGCVFETVSADGSLVGAVYSGGVRTASTALVIPSHITSPVLSTGRPSDGGVHRYAVEYRASRVYFTIDNVTCGSIANPNPQTVDMPWTAGVINDTAALGAARTFVLSTASVGQSGAQSIRIADRDFPARQQRVSATGQAHVQEGTTSTAPVKSNAALAAASFTVLASNAARRMATFFNDSTNILYLDLSGGVASTTSYSVQVPPGGYFELPEPCYTGLITAISPVASGTVRVTEIT